MTELIAITALNEIADLSGTAANIKLVTLDLNEGAAADQTLVIPLTLFDSRYTLVGAALPVVDETAIVYKTGTPASTLTFDVDAYTAARVVTLPDAAMTVAGLEVANTFTANQTIQPSGTGYGDDLVIVNNGTPGRILTITGDGRVGIGAKGVQDVAFEVNLNGAKTSGNPMALTSGGKTLTMNTTGFNTTNANFAFGANSAGAALNMVAPDNYALQINGSNVAFLGEFASSINTRLQVGENTAATNSVIDVQRISINSTGTPAAGLGAALSFVAESTTTSNQDLGRLTYEWATATHATRKALGKLTVHDTAEREAIRWEASGTAPMIGVLGAAAVVRQDITGSRGGNAALADLLTKLATFGWITDSTT